MAHARRVADRIVAGRVLINTLALEPMAPFGGFKQSGIGREYGAFGLEAFLEPNPCSACTAPDTPNRQPSRWRRCNRQTVNELPEVRGAP
jgi:Aldehyde dehydrogenase family